MGGGSNSALKWPEFDAMRAARQMTINANTQSAGTSSPPLQGGGASAEEASAKKGTKRGEETAKATVHRQRQK